MTARNQLAEKKIDADFSIIELTKTGAIIDDIRLSGGGNLFFSADRVTASYNWREIADLKFIKINVKKPVIDIEIDETGRIINAWMPASSGGGNQGVIIETLVVEDGRADVITPYGHFNTAISANINNLEEGSLSLDFAPTDSVFGQFKGRIGGLVEAKLKDRAADVAFDVSLPQGEYGPIRGQSLRLKGRVKTDMDDPAKMIVSDWSADFGSMIGPDVASGSGTVSWQGQLSLPGKVNDGVKAIGAWSADLTQALITNDMRRKRLAESLSLKNTLESISSLAPLSPDLTKTVDQFLSGSNVSARGRLDMNTRRTQVFLTEPAVMTSSENSKNQLRITPSDDKALYSYDAETYILALGFDADLLGRRPMSLKKARLAARSESGRSLSNIQAFKTGLSTKTAWRARTPDGRPVRLAPMQAFVDYEVSGESRKIALSGKIDFDGDVPGGYVRSAKTHGDLRLILTGDTQTGTFKPANDGRIHIDKLETATDWAFEDLEFELIDTSGPLYGREGGARRLVTRLADAKGRMFNQNSGKDMRFAFAAADVSGNILSDGQDWTMAVQNASMVSDTLPSAGTVIDAPRADLTAKITPNAPVFFTVESPSANVKTNLISAKNMYVQASGNPDNIKTVFDKGKVKFAAGELPVLPLNGTLNYDGMIWAGQAQTVLPRAEKTPITVTYEFSDGVGSADVKITDLHFTPRGLQPKHLVSALAGKISRVKGKVSSNIKLSFGTDRPLQSSGNVILTDIEAGTLPGPLSGINGALTFSSFFPLATDGLQTVKIARFNPGFPLQDGTFSFEVIPDGIKVHSASWPLGTGTIDLLPTTWLYSAAQNRVVLEVNEVRLGELFAAIGSEKFTATGTVNGRLPVLIEGVKVQVENGRVAVKDGGVIKYQAPQTDAAGEANAYAGYTFEALKNLEYQELEAQIDGPLDGPMKLRMKFDGSNPEVLYGAKFRFNVGIEGELLNIARSFQVGKNISAKMLEEIKSSQANK